MNNYTRYQINRNNRSGRNSRSGANRRSRRKYKKNYTPIILGCILALLLAAAIIFLFVKNKKQTEETSVSETEVTFADDGRIRSDLYIDLSKLPGLSGAGSLSIRGMNRQEIVDAVTKRYDWSMAIVNEQADVGSTVKPTVSADYEGEAEEQPAENPEGNTEYEDASADHSQKEIFVTGKIELPDYIKDQTISMLDSIFDEDRKGVEGSKTFEVSLHDVNTYIADAVQQADDMWYREAKGGSIGSYDAEKDEFLFEDASDGCRVEKEKLKDDLLKAFSNGKYDAQIKAELTILPAGEAGGAGEYRIIAEYVTHTTNNSVRNNNVDLACKALNGTIVRPGEELSFNEVIGERTAEKGYGAAAAYYNNEVIQEIGGGVCQVSSTLYNAVLIAGLKTTMRRSHTFKPTYVTPGQDATVSWKTPDYRFANIPYDADAEYSNKETYAIGIRAKYNERTVTVSIYGRPVLKDGYELSLESEQIATYDVVRKLIPPEDVEKEPTTGDEGSAWKTYLIVKKDGKEISRTLEHSALYSGHTEWYREEESTSETESVSEEGLIDGEGPIGPAGDPSLKPSPLEPGDVPMETEPTEPAPGPGDDVLPQTPEDTSPLEPGGSTQYIDISGGPGIEG